MSQPISPVTTVQLKPVTQRTQGTPSTLHQQNSLPTVKPATQPVQHGQTTGQTSTAQKAPVKPRPLRSSSPASQPDTPGTSHPGTHVIEPTISSRTPVIVTASTDTQKPSSSPAPISPRQSTSPSSSPRQSTSPKPEAVPSTSPREALPQENEVPPPPACPPPSDEPPPPPGPPPEDDEFGPPTM